MKQIKNKAARFIAVLLISLSVGSFGIPGTAMVYAGDEAYLGEIVMFAGNFAPRGWAFCEGQILSISENTALYSLLGTTYGGNGTTTFALPDLRGRSPIGAGQVPGSSYYTLGQTGGDEALTALTSQMPTHNHSLKASTSDGTTNTPGLNTVLAKAVTPDRQEVNIYVTDPANVTMGNSSVGDAGLSQPQSTRDPYLAIHYIISLNGTFPSHP